MKKSKNYLTNFFVKANKRELIFLALSFAFVPSGLFAQTNFAQADFATTDLAQAKNSMALDVASQLQVQNLGKIGNSSLSAIRFLPKVYLADNASGATGGMGMGSGMPQMGGMPGRGDVGDARTNSSTSREFDSQQMPQKPTRGQMPKDKSQSTQQDPDQVVNPFYKGGKNKGGKNFPIQDPQDPTTNPQEQEQPNKASENQEQGQTQGQSSQNAQAEKPNQEQAKTQAEQVDAKPKTKVVEQKDRKNKGKVNQEDTVIVTGAKVEQLAKDATEKVSVVTAEDIESMGARNLVEILSQVPGITINEHPMESVSMQGLKGDYVKVMIDGISMGGDIGGSAPINLVPAADIERIEIIQGASSALYGSDAMAGVINIITKKNKDKTWWIALKNEIDTYKHYYGSLYAGYKHQYFALTGIGTFEYMPGLNAKEVDAMGNDVLVLVGPKNRLGYTKFKIDGFTPIGDVSAYITANEHLREITLSPSIGTNFYTRNTDGGIKADLFLSDFSRLNSFLVYKYMDYFNDLIYPKYGTYERKNSHFKEVEFDTNYSHSFTSEHGLLTGINIKWEGMEGIDFKESKQSMLIGMFAQYEYNYLGENWLKVVPGFRVDVAPKLMEEDKKILFQFTPKLSIKYDPLDNLTLRLSYGMGFKVPSLKQKYWLFFHPAPANFVLFGNPDLKAETSQGLNASIDYEPVDKLILTGTAFYNFINNLIFTEDLSNEPGLMRDKNGELRSVAGMRRYNNLDQVITTGYSLSLKYQMEWFHLTASYNYLYMLNYIREKATYETASYYVPHQFKINTKFIIPYTYTNIDLQFNWDLPQPIKVGFDRRASGMVQMPSAKPGLSPDKVMVNMKISQNLWDEHFNIYLGIRNMFNNYNFINGSNDVSQIEYFGLVEGITAYFGFNFKWN